MKQNFLHQRMFLLAAIATIAFNSFAQQHFTLTCNNNTGSTGCRECNSACALIYTPQLNGNAILLATSPNGNSRLLGVWYKKVNGIFCWNVNYQDAKPMNYGEQFDVQYYANPDPDYQFVHHVYQPGTTQTIYTSYIDHIHLNGNPKADFRYIANGNGTNIYPVTFKYDAAAGKWYFYNINGKPLDVGAVYNIVIEPNDAFIKPDIIIDTTHPKIKTKPGDTIPGKLPVDNPASCNCIIPTSLPPDGIAGGDLGGSYPSPSVAKIAGRPVSNILPHTGDVLKWSGVTWEPDSEKSNTGTAYIPGLGLSLDGSVLNVLKDEPIWNAAKLVGRDIVTTAPVVGQVLKWGGGSWYPADDNTSNTSLGWTLNGNNLTTTNSINVGIGNTMPKTPLSFPATLGKKITLYPGTTGDVGFGVVGNRLQIYADNPNADVAIGYDAAGTFTERLAIKANGALAVNSNTGQPGQVLTSAGNSGPPVWAAAGTGNNIQTYVKNPTETYAGHQAILNQSNPGYVFTALMHNLEITKKSRLIINAQFDLVGPLCPIGCGDGYATFEIIINGVNTTFYLHASAPHDKIISASINNFMYDINPGNYLLEFRVRLQPGSDLIIWGNQSSVIVVPLE